MSLPEKYEVWQPPMENQLFTGNCVAQAIANILECIRYRREGEHRDYSVGYIYGNRSRGQTHGRGMIPREAIDAMCKEGDVLRSFAESSREMPDIQSWFEGVYPVVCDLADTIQAYVRFHSAREIKEFIFRYNIPTLVVVNSSALTEHESDTGLHAIVICGWDGDRLKYHNSWGKMCEWGYITYSDTIEEWGLIPMEKQYTDVDGGRWSSDAIDEASADGILLGYPDGTFAPERPLTREETAVVYQRIKRQVKKMIKEGM